LHQGARAVDTAVIATAVPQRRRIPFVGREAELRALEELLCGETQVICLHGIAGMGKSGVLRAFVQRAREGGASVIELDCRTVEPTEWGFLQAVGGLDDVSELARHLRGFAPPVALALDHYEVFRLMDTWLRQVLVPSLPAGVSVVLAGRERPVAGWLEFPRSAGQG
jgi:AAA ATPase domain